MDTARLRLLLRRLLKCGAATLVVALALLGLAHLPMARRSVADAIEARVGRVLGARVHIGDIHYNLFALRVELDDVALAAADPAAAPFFAARHILVDVPWQAVRGVAHLQLVSIGEPRLELAGLRQWLAARPHGNGHAPRRVDIDRVVIDGLAIAGDTAPGAYTVDVSHLSLDTGEGTLVLRAVGGSQAGELRLGPYRTHVTGASGQLAYDGQRVRLSAVDIATADLHRARVDGDVLLLTDEPAWNLSFRVTGDVGRVLAAWPAVPITGGGATVDGTMTGPLGSPVVALHGRADRLVLAGTEVRGLDATASASGRGFTVQRAMFAWLGAAVEASLDLPVGRESRDSARVDWKGLDTAALVRAVDAPLAVRGVSDGAATLSGRLADVGTWHLDATTRLAPRPGPASVGGQARLKLDEGRWSLAWPGRFDNANVTLDARGRLGAPGAARVSGSSLDGRATVDTPDIAALMQSLELAGLHGAGAFGERVSGAVSVTADLGGRVGAPDLSSRFDGVSVEVRKLGPVRLDGVVRLQRGTVLTTDDLLVGLRGSRVRVAGTADLRRGPLALDIDARGVDAADVASLLGPLPWLPTSGHADARGTIRGTTRAPEASLDVEARDVAWIGQALDRVRGHVDLGAGRVAFAPIEAQAGHGRLELRGNYDSARDAVDLTATATAWPIAPLVLPDEGEQTRRVDLSGVLDGTLRVSGPIATPGGGGRLHVSGARISDARPDAVDATISLGGDGGAHLTATVPALAGSLEGDVRVARPWAFTARAAVQALSLDSAARTLGRLSLGEAVTGHLTATAEARGTLAAFDDSDATITVDAFDGSVHEVPLRIERPAVLRVAARELSTTGVEVRSGGTTARLRGVLARGNTAGALDLDLDGTLADLAPLVRRATGRAVDATGRVRLAATARGTLESPVLSGEASIADGEMRLTDGPTVTGLRLDAALSDGTITVRALDGQVDTARVSLGGRVPLHLFDKWLPQAVTRANPSTGVASLEGDVRNLTLGTVGRLAGNVPGADLDGALDAHIALHAERPVAEAVAGTIRLDTARVSITELQIAQVAPVTIAIAAGKATFDEWRWQGQRTDLALRGSVDFLATPLAFDVEALGPIDLTALGAIVPGRTAGVVRTDARLRRLDGSVQLTGELVLTKGAWIDRSLQVALSDMNGTVRLLSDRILVDGVTGRLNGGDVAVTGAIAEKSGGGYAGALAVTARRVTVEYPRRVVSEFDADVQLVAPGPRGTPLGLTGSALVRPGVLRASPRQLAMMFMPGPPMVPTPASERRQRLLSLMGLDVELKTADDLVADSNELRAQVGGELRFTGTLAEPGLLGRAEIREDGELFFVGRLYKMRAGFIEFVNPTAIEPRLNLVGQTTVSDYEIQMQLTGPVDRLDLRLRSTPPLSQSDLASLLATGQTLKERREAATEANSEAARSQMLSAVSSEYLGTLGRWFGVDTVRIESTTRDLSAVDLDPVSRLNATKRLGPYFEVTYSQNIQENDDIRWILRYKPGWYRLEGASTFTTSEGETYEIRQELLLGGGARPPERRRQDLAREGPRITTVAVTGAPPDETRQITKSLSLSAGDRFDVFKWQRDRERVERFYADRDRLRTTVIASRRPGPEGITLEYAIERGGVTRLRVEGYEFGRTDLEALRHAWAESPVDEFVDEALVETARLALARSGFPGAHVTAQLNAEADDEREAVVRVVTGPRVPKRQVEFSGNTTFASERLAQVLRDAKLGDQPWVEPSAAVPPIEGYYAAAGFLGVRAVPQAPRTDGDVLTLPITIVEGPQYTVSAVTFNGVRQLDPAKVLDAFGLTRGTVYTADATSRGTRAVTSLYNRSGHPDATARLRTALDRDAHTAQLDLIVEEGIRQVVAGVGTDGTDVITRAGLVSKAITVKADTPVDSQQIEATQRRLYDLGTFQAVEPRLEPQGEKVTLPDGGEVQPVKVVFGLEEYPRYRFRYGFQVNTSTLSRADFVSSDVKPGGTLDIRRNNLFGYGIDAGLGGFLTTDRYRVRGLLTNPTLGGRPIENTMSVTQDFRKQLTSTSQITSRSTELNTEQRFRPFKRVEVAYGYDLSYQSVDLTVGPRGASAFDFRLDARLADLTTTLTYDSRDNLLNPRRGQFHSGSIEAGTRWLASEVPYASYLGQHFLFVPAGRVTLASALRYGTVGIANDQEDTIAATLVRFKTGGGTTVRGYRTDDLTPMLFPGFPRGGDVLIVLNEEVRVPLRSWLGMVAFVDAGNAFAEYQDVSLSGLKVGVGTGLRVVTPFGVVRLDVGFPRPRPEHYPLALWYFSFGHAF